MPYVIDFLPVGTKASSGDAIALCYGSQADGFTTHIVDGGYADTAPGLIAQVHAYGTDRVDHVVLTHADGDHAAGLVEVLETLDVKTLWMNRPWLYADEIIHHFHGNWTVEGLVRHLRDKYPTLVKLEDIANRRHIPILEAFQGAQVGAFTVLAPSRSRYLTLLPDFDKTPERKATADNPIGLAAYALESMTTVAKALARWVVESWHGETLSDTPDRTSASNESSVVQMATIDGQQLVLTGDVGPDGLNEAANFLESRRIQLQPRFIQVPHHGSRRNVTPATLDRWLGPLKPRGQAPTGFAFCSAARLDESHPRKKVTNAFTRRGYEVHVTRGRSIYLQNKMGRNGDSLTPEPFYNEVEQ